MKKQLCSACGNPFTELEWENHHHGHSADCTLAKFAICHCDLPLHDKCCNVCILGNEISHVNKS